MAKFEKVSRFAEDASINLPTRATAASAGYDFETAEEVIVPSWTSHMMTLGNIFSEADTIDYNVLESMTKLSKAKPTLVSTGIKCELTPDTYLELSVRSSTPLKHWLVLANGVGIIDADYYNNPGTEGEIFFQLINLSPKAIKIPKGTKIGQGIIKPYLITDDDAATGARTGGFGSTSK